MIQLKQGTNFCPRVRRDPNYFSTKPRTGLEMPIPLKKEIDVENIYTSLFHTILTEFNIPVVKKTFGKGLVRVCCTTVEQLENITSIMKTLLELHLIEEIGMPLDNSYKMMPLVLFLKPVNIESGMQVGRTFQECAFEYHDVVTDVENATPASQEIFQEGDQFRPTINLFRPDHMTETPMNDLWSIIICLFVLTMRLVTIINILNAIYKFIFLLSFDQKINVILWTMIFGVLYLMPLLRNFAWL